MQCIKILIFLKRKKERYEKYWSALQGNLSSRIKSLDNEVQMAGWSTQEMLDGVQPTLNLAKIGATDLGTASDILTKILVGLVEILFKKYSVNCWKAKLILIC